jgi:hypothetical protein
LEKKREGDSEVDEEDGNIVLGLKNGRASGD